MHAANPATAPCAPESLTHEAAVLLQVGDLKSYLWRLYYYLNKAEHPVAKRQLCLPVVIALLRVLFRVSRWVPGSGYMLMLFNGPRPDTRS